MVAETIGGETVRAWIWQPEYEVSWVAERGAGTWRDGVRVQTVPVPQDREPQGVTSMWCMRDQRLGDLPPMRLSWVCCGVDYPRVIEGAADYILYSRSNPWDHAPGTLLVTEAGGTVGHPDGTRHRPALVAARAGHRRRLLHVLRGAAPGCTHLRPLIRRPWRTRLIGRAEDTSWSTRRTPFDAARTRGTTRRGRCSSPGLAARSATRRHAVRPALVAPRAGRRRRSRHVLRGAAPGRTHLRPLTAVLWRARRIGRAEQTSWSTRRTPFDAGCRPGLVAIAASTAR